MYTAEPKPPGAGWCYYRNGRLARDRVADGDRYYRCSVCNRRLWPKEDEHGFILPVHKFKGYKLRRIKEAQHAMRRKK